MNKKSSRYTLALICLTVSLLLTACSSLPSIVQSSRSVSLGSITGHYESGISEGEVKKVILYLRESAIIRQDEKFNFTLEKHPDEYRVIIDLEEIDKLDLTESPAALMMDLFGSSDSSEEVSEAQLLQVLFRSLAIGLTEDVLNEYTEVRVKDNEKKQYRIYPPSFE